MSFKILDCTLRDGGYYTDWKFNPKLVKLLVKTLDSNGVDIIELGYKSPVIGGPYRKCNDGFISSIIDFEIKSNLAFMIDVKDYITEGKINEPLIKDIIKPSTVFKICRVAAKYNEVHYIPQIVKILQDLGYDVICNLMAISKVLDKEIEEYIKTTKNINLKAVYIADSFGALYPKNVRDIFNKYKINGIHTHDNMGLAFANCLEAINQGATYIDGTLTGMGRGVGNVTTEQLLTHRGNINSDLLECIDEFNKMKSYYGWGNNTLYHRAGKEHIHPLYMQDLNQSNLNNTQLLKAIDNLTECHLYDKTKLKHLKTQRAVVVIPARYKSSRFPGKPLAKIDGKEMILHVAKKAEQAIGKDNVYIATENSKIANIVKKSGYKVIITSDSCLTGTDRVAEASYEINADIFVNVQGDEPMIDPDDIKNAIKLKQDNPGYVINCMSKLHKDEDASDKKIPKIICDLNNNLIYSSRNPLPGSKNSQVDNVMKQVCIYAFSKKQLQQFYDTKKTPLEKYEDIEIVRCIEKGIKVKMLEVDKISYAVDYPEDIKVIEKHGFNKI
jgi:3-deoxy-manno-octulosonate cytidylyltransferase (CMP-KDO synthetase)